MGTTTVRLLQGYMAAVTGVAGGVTIWCVRHNSGFQRGDPLSGRILQGPVLWTMAAGAVVAGGVSATTILGLSRGRRRAGHAAGVFALAVIVFAVAAAHQVRAEEWVYAPRSPYVRFVDGLRNVLIPLSILATVVAWLPARFGSANSHPGPTLIPTP